LEVTYDLENGAIFNTINPAFKRTPLFCVICILERILDRYMVTVDH